MPILTKEHDASYVTNNIMINNTAYGLTNLDLFMCENIGDPDQDNFLFQVANTKRTKDEMVDWSDYHLSEYLCWRPRTNKKLSFSQLMRQEPLKKWFFNFFFKLTIPCKRTRSDFSKLVYQPLNLTFIFRLLIHLNGLGYPAHWLSSILSSLLSDRLTTTARPPRSCPRSIAEARASYPVREMSIQPFTTELRTLATMWRRVLPFGFASTGLPALDDIYRYTITWDIHQGGDLAAPHNIIVFVHEKETRLPIVDLRSILLDDETAPTGKTEFGLSAPQRKQLREHGIIVISVFEWTEVRDDIAMGAKVWMSKTQVDAMLADGDWAVHLFRNDSWGPQSGVFGISDNPGLLKLGEKWIDVKV